MLRAVPAGRTTRVLLALCMVVAGCDDSDEPAKPRETGATATATTTSPEARPRGDTLTASQYRKAVNRLCREDEAAADRIADFRTPEAIGRSLRRTLTYTRKRRPRYEALRPPAQLRAGHRESRELSDRAERELARLVDRVEAGADPLAELRSALPTLTALLERGNRLARRLGTKDCIVEVPPAATAPREDVS